MPHLKLLHDSFSVTHHNLANIDQITKEVTYDTKPGTLTCVPSDTKPNSEKHAKTKLLNMLSHQTPTGLHSKDWKPQGQQVERRREK
jgi:hypothetical protein